MRSLGGSIQYTNSSFWRPNMVIKEIIDDKMLYMDLFRCGGLVGIVGVVQRGFQVFEHRPKACYRHSASPFSRQQEFCCDLLQNCGNFFVEFR